MASASHARREGVSDLAVVHLRDEEEESSAFRNLGLLGDRLGKDRVILYVSPSTGLAALAELAEAGFRSVFVEGVDDDPISVRRVLGRAAARVFLRQVSGRMEGHLEAARREFLMHALASSVRNARVEALARDFGSTARTLRTRFRECGLPPPGHILRWGRLCHAIGLRSIGVRSTARVSFLVGYEDPASLCRLYRELLHCAAGDVPEDEMVKLAAERILDQLAELGEDNQSLGQETA